MIRTLTLLVGLVSTLPLPALAGPDRLCLQLNRSISFCEAENGLHPVLRTAPEALALFERADNVHGKIVAEEVALGTSVSEAQVRAAIVATVERQVLRLGGRLEVTDQIHAARMQPSGTLRYSFAAGAKRVEALHSYLLRDRMILQFITFTERSADVGAPRAAHATFLSQVRLTEQDPAL